MTNDSKNEFAANLSARHFAIGTNVLCRSLSYGRFSLIFAGFIGEGRRPERMTTESGVIGLGKSIGKPCVRKQIQATGIGASQRYRVGD